MATRRRRTSKRARSTVGAEDFTGNTRFPITQAAASALDEKSEIRGADQAQAAPAVLIDTPQARDVLAAVERAAVDGHSRLLPVASAIRLEIAIAEAEKATGANPLEGVDPIFRLCTRRWGMVDGDLAGLVPVRDPQLRIITFDDSQLAHGRTKPKNDRNAGTPHRRHVIAFVHANSERREPLFIGEGIAQILELSNGTRTALEIATEVDARSPYSGDRRGLQQVEELFVAGLLWLYEARIDRIETAHSTSM
jgi:hypothetical protein